MSQTLSAPVQVSIRPNVGQARAERAVATRDKVTREIHKLRVEGTPRLVVDAIGGSPRLAWEITSGGRYADGTPSRLLTYVDARTGKVIRREERIQTTDGQGNSLYSGTVPLQVTPSGSSYLLKDPTRGGTYTTDFGNKTDGFLCQVFGTGCKPGTTYSSTDTSFGNGSNSSRESAAVDAQYGTNVTWDYYKNIHGRNGIFGNGSRFLQPGPLRQQLRQRVLGRHQDDVRRRRRRRRSDRWCRSTWPGTRCRTASPRTQPP